MQAAAVARDHLNDVPHAFELTARGLHEMPENGDAMSLLIDLANGLDERDYWLSLADSLAFVAEHTNAVRPELYVTAGEALERSDEWHRAFDSYVYAFGLSQGTIGADVLFASAWRTGRTDELTEATKAALDGLEPHEKAVRLAHFASLYEMWDGGS